MVTTINAMDSGHVWFAESRAAGMLKIQSSDFVKLSMLCLITVMSTVLVLAGVKGRDVWQPDPSKLAEMANATRCQSLFNQCITFVRWI